MGKIDLLNDLITEGESLTSSLSFVPAREGVIRIGNPVYRTNQVEKYQNWQSSVLRFIKSYYSSDIDEVKEALKRLSPDNHRKILGILNAIKLFPEEPEANSTSRNPETNITIHNTQNNTQTVVFNLIVEAIKDEINGKELRELKDLLKEYEKEPTKDKSKLIDKIKGFGSDVLTNMIANILTNPSIYSGLM